MTEQTETTVSNKSNIKFNRELKPEEVKELNKEQRKKYFEFMRQRDAEVVRGKFIFHEVPGGIMSFSFAKWPGDKVKDYNLRDGEVCSVPLGVAKHLNKECKYPIHSYQMDENNKPKGVINNWIRRCSFQSLEFIDVEDLNPVGTATKHPDA